MKRNIIALTVVSCLCLGFSPIQAMPSATFQEAEKGGEGHSHSEHDTPQAVDMPSPEDMPENTPEDTPHHEKPDMTSEPTSDSESVDGSANQHSEAQTEDAIPTDAMPTDEMHSDEMHGGNHSETATGEHNAGHEGHEGHGSHGSHGGHGGMGHGGVHHAEPWFHHGSVEVMEVFHLSMASSASSSLVDLDVATTEGSEMADDMAMTEMAMDDMAVPSLKVVVHPDTRQGWNIEVQTENFAFAPEQVNQANQPNVGHGHLYVDGEKIARLYGNWYYLDQLASGTREVTVSLHANGHEVWMHEGEAIATTTTIEVP